MSNNRELKKGYPRAMVELSMFCGYTHTYWHCGLPCLNSLCCLEMDGTEGRCLHWCRNCSEAPNCCAPLTLLSSLHHRTRGLLVSTKGLQKGLQSRAQNKRFACVNKGFTKGVTKQNTEQEVCLCQQRVYKRGYKAEHEQKVCLCQQHHRCCCKGDFVQTEKQDAIFVSASPIFLSTVGCGIHCLHCFPCSLSTS
jgi:hypothetical protein